MAKGRKTGGRDFKKGQSGNPGGMSAVPADIKEARKLTKMEFERAVNKYLFAKKEDIQKATADPNTPLIELLIGSIIHKGVINGDQKRLDFLLDRLLGKVLQTHKVDGNLTPPQVVLNMPSNERERVEPKKD